jgi:deferrochelatase/peroxidase EfeB
VTTVVRHHGHDPGGPAADARRTEDDCRLQDGIYFRRDHRPGRCYRLLLVNVKPDATRSEVKESIASVWMRVQALRAELLEDLRPPRLQAPPRAPDPPKPELTCLLGFGAPLFERYPDLGSSPDLIRIETEPGPFPALPRVAEADRATGEADLALQFIAESELAVSRAVVEAGMLIKTQSLSFDVAALYGGFNREDRRSWLGFHDGISNIAPELRRSAIETKVARSTEGDPAWMDGGTYMGFLRLAIDLEMWRGLDRADQELSVGRDLQTGCPITRSHGGVREVPDGCPEPHGPGTPLYRNPHAPPIDPDNLARSSHMNRANLNRPQDGPIEDKDNRIFRQGYEFVEALPGGRLQVGVNFVSFQRRISSLTTILTNSSWLGDTNFGGTPSRKLLTLIGGGYYAIPPTGGQFPGAEMF